MMVQRYTMSILDKLFRREIHVHIHLHLNGQDQTVQNDSRTVTKSIERRIDLPTALGQIEIPTVEFGTSVEDENG